jgi:hypothetical protein
VWAALGDVDNYVEPFAGSLAVLLGRPGSHRRKCETVNDADAFLANFWRALAADPEAVAYHADWPVNETDLFARHLWLVNTGRDRLRYLEADPDWYDPAVAGWWAWGVNAWPGSGWCSGKGPWHLADTGQGVHRQLPDLGHTGQRGLAPWFTALAARGSAVSGCVAETGPGSSPAAPCTTAPQSACSWTPLLQRRLHCRPVQPGHPRHQHRRPRLGRRARERPAPAHRTSRLPSRARRPYAFRLAHARLHQEPRVRHGRVRQRRGERGEPAQRAAVVLPALHRPDTLPAEPPSGGPERETLMTSQARKLPPGVLGGFVVGSQARWHAPNQPCCAPPFRGQCPLRAAWSPHPPSGIIFAEPESAQPTHPF